MRQFFSSSSVSPYNFLLLKMMEDVSSWLETSSIIFPNLRLLPVALPALPGAARAGQVPVHAVS